MIQITKWRAKRMPHLSFNCTHYCFTCLYRRRRSGKCEKYCCLELLIKLHNNITVMVVHVQSAKVGKQGNLLQGHIKWGWRMKTSKIRRVSIHIQLSSVNYVLMLESGRVWLRQVTRRCAELNNRDWKSKLQKEKF